MRVAVRYLGKVLIAFLLLIVFWSLWNRDLVSYGWMQLKGQAKILYHARPVEEILADPLVHDSVKSRLKFIDVIRRFAIDSLGMKDSKSYTTYFDQQSKPVLWVLTASEPYKLKAYHWKFPVVGEVSYKGFFERDRGLIEDSILRLQGFDTDLGPVSAWSTLGWFTDPILSGMLRRTDGQLAELLIHEMTHSTLYVKSDVNFNENLASAVGEVGADLFLSNYFGYHSKEHLEYLKQKEDADMFSGQMLLASRNLDTLYTRIESLDEDLKFKFKYNRIREIVTSLDTLNFNFPIHYKSRFVKKLPNNTYFLSYIRYNSQKEEMRNELKNVFNNNIADYLNAIRERHD